MESRRSCTRDPDLHSEYPGYWQICLSCEKQFRSVEWDSWTHAQKDENLLYKETGTILCDLQAANRGTTWGTRLDPRGALQNGAALMACPKQEVEETEVEIEWKKLLLAEAVLDVMKRYKFNFLDTVEVKTSKARRALGSQLRIMEVCRNRLPIIEGSTTCYCGMAFPSFMWVQGFTYPTRVRCDVNWERLCLLYTSPSPRDGLLSRMPSSA